MIGPTGAREAPRTGARIAGLFSVLTMLLVLAVARPAPAAAAPPQRRVLLVVNRADDRFAARIRAEIAGLGLSVITLEAGHARDPEPLEAMARSKHAVAIVRMIPTRKGVEVWMADETSGRSMLRQLVVDESPGGPNESLVALQTAELLRTSLRPQPSAATALPGGGSSAVGGASTVGEASKGDSPAIVGRPPPASPPPIKANVGAGIGALLGPGTDDTAIQGWLSIDHPVGQRWGVALDLGGPLHQAAVSGPEGTARIGTALVGAAFFARFEDAGDMPFFGTLGLGFAVLRVGSKGEPVAPLVARSTSAFTSAPYLRAEGGFALTTWVRIGLRALVGATATKLTVQFAGNDAATWGRPFVAPMAFADFVWR
ncbi:MAG TPA: hypothetical protein VGP07_14700 [Polyangia bacterium]|jgi:hypothetical protein